MHRTPPKLLKPYDGRLMRCYPVSTRINHVAHDDAECSAPVERQRIFTPLGMSHSFTASNFLSRHLCEPTFRRKRMNRGFYLAGHNECQVVLAPRAKVAREAGCRLASTKSGASCSTGESVAAHKDRFHLGSHGPSIQEALDALEKSGVHVGRRSGVGSYDEKRNDNELRQR